MAGISHSGVLLFCGIFSAASWLAEGIQDSSNRTPLSDIEERLLWSNKLITEQSLFYNRYVRPSLTLDVPLTVNFGLSITQVLDMDEKHQILTISVWKRQLWLDHRLSWNPENFNNITVISLPPYLLWYPDIVLYNSAKEANHETTINQEMTKIRVYSDGTCYYAPPIILTSPCKLNIEYFPFDKQSCSLKFGSWAYTGHELLFMLLEDHIIKEDFWENSEWEVVSAPGFNFTMKYPCCPEVYSNVVFTLVLKRRSYFYVINLIIPCMIFSFLTLLVFYLPSDSGEKISLCISILLALSVFQLLVAEIMPPTSTSMPLIMRYLIFTEAIVVGSIVMTVVVLNVHHRTGSSKMSPLFREIFIHVLPKYICLQRRKPESKFGSKFDITDRLNKLEKYGELRKKNSLHSLTSSNGSNGEISKISRTYRSYSNGGRIKHTPPHGPVHVQASSKAERQLLEESRFITGHLKEEDRIQEEKADWRFVAAVIDRIMLIIFTVTNVVGGTLILIQRYADDEDIDIGVSTINEYA